MKASLQIAFRKWGAPPVELALCKAGEKQYVRGAGITSKARYLHKYGPHDPSGIGFLVGSIIETMVPLLQTADYLADRRNDVHLACISVHAFFGLHILQQETCQTGCACCFVQVSLSLELHRRSPLLIRRRSQLL